MRETEHSSTPAAVRITRFSAGQGTASVDHVALEEPLEIRVRGQSIAVTMRTPGHDAELACGFLYGEGLLRARLDVIEVAHCAGASEPENILNVFLAPSVPFDLSELERHVYASSSCGICGKASIETIHRRFPPLAPDHLTIPCALLECLPAKLRAAQQTFQITGGLHAAGLFDERGDLMCLREDIGRHNAVDKVIGWAFLQKLLPLSNHLLLVSGRASFEIVQKALAARIPFIAAISAPSSLAVEFSSENGQTLVGFLRGSAFNVYSCPERIKEKA